MKVTIDIPKEYEQDFIDDKFTYFFERVYDDITGVYERQIADMFFEAFNKAIVIEIDPTANITPAVNTSFKKDGTKEGVEEKLLEVIGSLADDVAYYRYPRHYSHEADKREVLRVAGLSQDLIERILQ